MIDFNFYECVKLEDVAEFGRAKEGFIYPRGTSTLQISATKGQIGYLDERREVHTKEVAIIPQAGINPRYFNIILQKNIEVFLHKYKTGLNIQEKEVGNFPIELHNPETQEAVVKMFDYLEAEEAQIQAEINVLETMKNTMLDYMLV